MAAEYPEIAKIGSRNTLSGARLGPSKGVRVWARLRRRHWRNPMGPGHSRRQSQGIPLGSRPDWAVAAGKVLDPSGQSAEGLIPAPPDAAGCCRDGGAEGPWSQRDAWGKTEGQREEDIPPPRQRDRKRRKANTAWDAEAPRESSHDGGKKLSSTNSHRRHGMGGGRLLSARQLAS